MAAAAPPREQRAVGGNRHGAVSSEGQLGVRDRLAAGIEQAMTRALL